MSIVVSCIHKHYQKIHALNNVSFQVEKGEIVGLLGPNGAGKSSLIKIICSYNSANSGEVLINGYNIQSHSLKIREMIGYLPENNPLYNDMYVREYIDFASQLYKGIKKRRERVDYIIQKTGLLQVQTQKINSLSKGYKQRVGLAQALINNPSVLILDEPTSGLDPNQIIEIRSLIKEIGKDRTVLFSTHIMQEVESVCDRAIILNNGQVVADAAIRDLLKDYPDKNKIEIEFSGEVILEKLKDQVQGIIDVHESEGKVYIESSSEIDLRGDLFEFSVSQGLKILSLTKTEMTMEEVFSKLTSH